MSAHELNALLEKAGFVAAFCIVIWWICRFAYTVFTGDKR